MQPHLPISSTMVLEPFRTQLLKWIGNKQRMAHVIGAYFPVDYRCYFEPFLGSGGVLGVVAPHTALGSDAFKPLAQIWMQLASDPDVLIDWYRDRYAEFHATADRVVAYTQIRDRFNAEHNAADLLFLSRSCYGGVIRFRLDGFMSTPVGVHNPISPDSFAQRVGLWAKRTAGAQFAHLDYREAMALAGEGDIVYCDPPYSDSQTILYGAQRFDLQELFVAIGAAKERGARVALSIDGQKKSGRHTVDLGIPQGLFDREAMVSCGVSQLRRFQVAGETMDGEGVADRLLLTW